MSKYGTARRSTIVLAGYQVLFSCRPYKLFCSCRRVFLLSKALSRIIMNGKFLCSGLTSSPGQGAREPPTHHVSPLLYYPSHCDSPFCPFGSFRLYGRRGGIEREIERRFTISGESPRERRSLENSLPAFSHSFCCLSGLAIHKAWMRAQIQHKMVLLYDRFLIR